MSYTRRILDVEFELGEGSFGESGSNKVSLTGLRVQAIIKKAGQAGMNTADIRVFGLPPSVVRNITTLGKVLTGTKVNTVTLKAGDETGTAVVFTGTIQTAFQDYNAAPDVSVVIGAYTGILDALKPLPPSSFKGGADAATIIAGLATQMGYAFQNNGVSVQLSNQYLAGTGRDQALKCAEAANINIAFDDATIAIWPKNQARTGSAVVLSPTTGMIGYPAWMDTSIVVRSLYNPAFVFGCPIIIQDSAVENANGGWKIFSLTHELESETPGGKWFTTMECMILDHTSSQ